VSKGHPGCHAGMGIGDGGGGDGGGGVWMGRCMDSRGFSLGVRHRWSII
jgi:hypothetical protein